MKFFLGWTKGSLSGSPLLSSVTETPLTWWRLSKARFQVDQDIVALGAYGEDVHLGSLRRLRYAGRERERPGVPRADDRIAFDPPLAERTTAMGTDIIDGSQVSVKSSEAHRDPLRFSLDHIAFRWRLRCAAEFDPVRHSTYPPCLRVPALD